MSVYSASGERSAVERMSHLLAGFDHAIGISPHRVVIPSDNARHLPHLYPRLDSHTPASTMERFLDEEETRDGPAVALARIWGLSDVPMSANPKRTREEVTLLENLAHPPRATTPQAPFDLAGWPTHRPRLHPWARMPPMPAVAEPLDPMMSITVSRRPLPLDSPAYFPLTPPRIDLPQGPRNPMSISTAHSTFAAPAAKFNPAAIPSAPKVVLSYLSPQPSLSELAYRKRIYRVVAARLLVLGISQSGFTPFGASLCTQDTVSGSYADDFSTAASTPADLHPLNTRKRGGVGGSANSPDETPVAGLARKRSRAPVVLRIYACPYYRRNPDAVDFTPDGELKKCRTDGIKGGKIKEHVRRTHTKPAQCPKCGRRGDHGDIKAHIDKIHCTRNDAIVPVDAETVGTEKRLTETRGATWHVIFAILFPGDPVPLENAQYFVEAEIVVELVDSRQEQLAYAIAEHLDRSGTMLGELLNSAEYQAGLSSSHHSPGTAMVVAAAARLMVIFSRVPFVESIAPDPLQQHAGDINFDWLDDTHLEEPASDQYMRMMFGSGVADLWRPGFESIA